MMYIVFEGFVTKVDTKFSAQAFNKQITDILAESRRNAKRRKGSSVISALMG